jgi:hypothetical protein
MLSSIILQNLNLTLCLCMEKKVKLCEGVNYASLGDKLNHEIFYTLVILEGYNLDSFFYFLFTC